MYKSIAAPVTIPKVYGKISVGTDSLHTEPAIHNLLINLIL
jgi:hypothetical protein